MIMMVNHSIIQSFNKKSALVRGAGHHAQYDTAIMMIIIIMIIDVESFKKKVAFHFLRALRMFPFYLAQTTGTKGCKMSTTKKSTQSKRLKKFHH